ncbi:MAG TPA: DUF6079 family protein [Pyrinomonadaceae bacterium]|jgi:hypothetical protein|nr:DUF6079 family protein [Pyrinomonadaceae bacterium]
MKRAPDKIKDFVEPQAFDEVQNYTNDPRRALAAYRFTDATSDLLCRWLDALADLPRERGAARALAGLRGVGKSHTLAVFAALAAFPDLRATVADAHVASGAGRLLNRRYKVSRVERGTRSTLMEELCAAFAETFGGTEVEWKDDPARMLALAAGMSDGPLVLIIDTALSREEHVRRDDGPLLSELARAAAQLTVFVALALDDDIEGADGANVALSGAFQIDYLDPEHLYRIADLYLFRKTARARAALHDFYVQLRAAVPGFNWSEPRFTEIYPVHPLVAEIAHAVRLYARRFAFLPFAAEAVARAANRPALSLVLLDEVFDRTEYELRRSEDLKTSFVAYDDLAAHAVTSLPVMRRLQAKLILKGLFVISLDGRGATARELGAAMLLYDKAQPEAIIRQIEETLSLFAKSAPQGSLQVDEDGDAPRYRFTVGRGAAFESALAEATERLASDITDLSALLRDVARSRFADWPREGAGTGSTDAAEEFHLTWRGMPRPGRLFWKNAEEHRQPSETATACDWELQVLSPGANPLDASHASSEDASHASTQAEVETEHNERPAPPSRLMLWQPASLSTEERASLCRLIALRDDRCSALFEEYGETAHAAGRQYAALAERIWTRIYLDEGRLLAEAGGSAVVAFTDETRGAATLAQALEPLLAPSFEARFPQHPDFERSLDEREAAQLVGGLFGGANQSEESVQELARLFAEPLGLASLRGGLYTLEVGDQALKQPWVREVIATTDEADGEVVSLHAIYEQLRGEPYGLLREAQHLILAALVAQRRIELVTGTGDRITHRTLDRTLSWDEVAGVARAATLLHGAEQLTAWARLLTDQPKLSSIANPEARTAVRGALSAWLDEWRGRRLFEKFDALPDEGLTTSAWGLAVAVRKSFEAAAESIEALLADNITLEEGLQRTADAFGDSEEGFILHQKQLAQLTSYTEGLAEREQARTYLATAEPTTEEEIESARRELLMMTDDVHTLFDQDSCQRFNLLWREFQTHFIEHYATAHAKAAAATLNQQAVEELMRGEEWKEFEALSQLAIVNRGYWEEAVDLIDRARQLRCHLPVRHILQDRPACDCSFRLAHPASPQLIVPSLADVVGRGREAHRHTLLLWREPLAHALNVLAQGEGDEETAARARSLAAALIEGALAASFNWSDARLIEQALPYVEFAPARAASPPPLSPSLAPAALPVGEGEPIMQGQTTAPPEQWLDNLPGNPGALLDFVGESGRNAD